MQLPAGAKADHPVLLVYSLSHSTLPFLSFFAPKGAKAAAQPIPASKLETKVQEALSSFEKPEVKLEKAQKAEPQAPAEAIITPNAGGGAAIELPGSGASGAVKTHEKTNGIEVFDVTKEYHKERKAGEVIYGEGYVTKNHHDEIDTAHWIIEQYGGSITLVPEDSKKQKMTPDYIWDGVKWERKGISTAKAADAAVRKALHQLGGEDGGIILVTNPDLNIDDVESVVRDRMRRTNKAQTDVIYMSDGETKRITRYIKKRR